MPDRDVMVKLGGAFLQALLIAATYGLLRRFMPGRDPSVTDERLAELRSKYRWFDLALLPPYIAFVALFSWGLYEVLRPAAAWHVARQGPATFTIMADPIAMLLPAFFLALFAAAGPMWLLTRAWLGPQRYREYMTYSRYGQGFDAQQAVVLMAVAVVPLMLVLAALFADQYVRVTKTELVVDPFWGLAEHRRPLRDVTAVYDVQSYTTRNGKVVRRPHFVVRFREGSTWSTREGGRTPRPHTDAPVVRYIAQQAGVTVERVQSLAG